jgi:anaerobic selenocysteine-containing dehydrogenase
MQRRWFLKIAAVGAAGSAIAATGALAAPNAPVRTSLKYQDKPAANGDKCATCAHFVPGKTATDKGGCKVITGDTEISPNAWCVAYSKKA